MDLGTGIYGQGLSGKGSGGPLQTVKSLIKKTCNFQNLIPHMRSIQSIFKIGEFLVTKFPPKFSCKRIAQLDAVKDAKESYNPIHNQSTFKLDFTFRIYPISLMEATGFLHQFLSVLGILWIGINVQNVKNNRENQE